MEFFKFARIKEKALFALEGRPQASAALLKSIARRFCSCLLYITNILHVKQFLKYFLKKRPFLFIGRAALLSAARCAALIIYFAVSIT